MESNHGGRREGAGAPRKMEDPVRTTITLEREDLNALRERFGREWQEFLRYLIARELDAQVDNH